MSFYDTVQFGPDLFLGEVKMQLFRFLPVGASVCMCLCVGVELLLICGLWLVSCFAMRCLCVKFTV